MKEAVFEYKHETRLLVLTTTTTPPATDYYGVTWLRYEYICTKLVIIVIIIGWVSNLTLASSSVSSSIIERALQSRRPSIVHCVVVLLFLSLSLPFLLEALALPPLSYCTRFRRLGQQDSIARRALRGADVAGGAVEQASRGRL